MVATDGLPLDQVPGPSASVRVIVVPGHKADGPPIGKGYGLTTRVAVPGMVREQPVAT